MNREIFFMLPWLCLALSLGQESFDNSPSVTSVSRKGFRLSETYNKNGGPMDLAYGSDLTRMTAVDEKEKIIYVLGRQQITVLRADDNSISFLITQYLHKNYTGKHIEVCGEYVIVSAREGHILIYEAYKTTTSPNQLLMVNTVSVDKTPVHFQLYSSCSKIIVAIKGTSERPGKFAILKFGRHGEINNRALETPDSTLKYVTFDGIDFRSIVDKGYVLNKNKPQPNWISVNEDETKAYVSMTINNAIAVVSLETDDVLGVLPMGYKGNDGFDGLAEKIISIKNSPVFAVYNPDQIVSLNIDGVDYLFTGNAANIGSTKIPLRKLKVEPELEGDKTKALENCPRLKVVPVESTDYDGNGLANKIATFGGRSLSLIIPSLNDFQFLDDTGSTIEKSVEINFPEGFNANPMANETLADSFDSSSTTYGPNIEGLAVAKICNGQATMVVGGTRNPGTIHVYTVDNNNVVLREKHFQEGYLDKSSVYNDEQLKSNHRLWMRRIKSIHIMYSNTNTPWIVVGSAFISTVTVHKVRIGCTYNHNVM